MAAGTSRGAGGSDCSQRGANRTIPLKNPSAHAWWMITSASQYRALAPRLDSRNATKAIADA
jgi:hypothetical protein